MSEGARTLRLLRIRRPLIEQLAGIAIIFSTVISFTVKPLFPLLSPSFVLV